MRVREKQIHNGEAENHNGEIENAKLGGASAAPAGIARHSQIEGVGGENEQRDYIFGIVVPDVAGQPFDPDETESGADADRDQADEDAALAHTIEKVERGQSPHDVADAMFVEQALLGEVDNAQDAGEAEGGVGKDAEGYVEGEDDAGGGRCGEAVRRSELGDREKCEDEWENKGTDRTLAMEKFEAEIGEGEQPAEKGHRAGEVVVRDGVKTTGAFEEREIVNNETTCEQQGAEAPGPIAAGDQVADVGREASNVGRKCK